MAAERGSASGAEQEGQARGGIQAHSSLNVIRSRRRCLSRALLLSPVLEKGRRKNRNYYLFNIYFSQEKEKLFKHKGSARFCISS